MAAGGEDMAMNGDDQQRGVSRAAVATTIAGACLWLVATAFTITELGVVVGLLLWVWGVPAAAMALGGVALWCGRALARRRARPGEQPNVTLTPAAS
jgi:peptidoglycan/LPS O-acetylase OafA/YrhL